MFDGFGVDALIARHADLPDDGPALRMGIRPQHRRCQQGRYGNKSCESRAKSTIRACTQH